MICPHCREEIDMGLFGAGKSERSAREREEMQSRAKLDDANSSTRPNTRTLSEIKRERG